MSVGVSMNQVGYAFAQKGHVIYLVSLQTMVTPVLFLS